MPVPRSSPASSDAPGAAAAAPSLGLDLPLLPSDMPSLGLGLGTLGAKDVAHMLLEQLSSDLRAGQAAAAGDQQQQQDQDRPAAGREGGDGLGAHRVWCGGLYVYAAST